MFKFHQSKNMPRLDESGFTLLEIIAVLVILSIMAVVAVPKYFDLQTQARNETIKTAIAEGIARINGHFAKEILGGNTPSGISYIVGDEDDELGADLGDFDWTITPVAATATDPESLRIDVIGNSGALNNMTATRTIPVPGL